MINFFIDPLPDETFISWMRRYQYRVLHSETSLDAKLFGEQISMQSLDLAFGLENFVKTLSHISNYSVEQIIQDHTLWPFYINFVNESKWKRIVNFMRGVKINKRYRGLRLLNIYSGSLPMYCPKCRDEDIAKFGEIYWHRTHQIPDILICTKHNCFLETIISSDNSIRHLKNVCPNEVSCPERTIIENSCSQLLLISSKMESYLSTNWLTPTINTSYREGAFSKGYSNGRLVDIKKLVNDMNEFFEPVFSVYTDKQFDKHTFNLKAVFVSTKQIIHPLRHVFVRAFLETKSDTLAKNESPFGKGPFPCINRAANHFGEKHVSLIENGFGYRGFPKGKFQCTCGMIFSEYKNEFKTITLVIDHGNEWKEFVTNQISLGVCGSKISQRLGISFIQLRRWCCKYGIANSWKKVEPSMRKANFETRKDEFRQAWQKKGCLIEEIGLTAVTKMFQSEYNCLVKYDSEWLSNFNREYRNKVKSKRPEFDFKSIDEENVVLIKSAFKELIQSKIPRRISAGLLIRVSKANYQQSNKCKRRYALTTSLLNKLEETWDDFRIRKTSYNEEAK
ncbi:MAG: TnsD family Tn7-like transposition protein [Cyclobacteriaceae bacterium]